MQVKTIVLLVGVVAALLSWVKAASLCFEDGELKSNEDMAREVKQAIFYAALCWFIFTASVVVQHFL